jgi:hypothetical protein
MNPHAADTMATANSMPDQTIASTGEAVTATFRDQSEREALARSRGGYLFLLPPGRGGGGGFAFVVGENLPPFFGS